MTQVLINIYEPTGFEGLYLEDIEIEADVRYEDHGIGSYEYWGAKGNDSQMVWVCQDDPVLVYPEKYCPEVRQCIERYLKENVEEICRKLEEKAAEGNYDYEPDIDTIEELKARGVI